MKYDYLLFDIDDTLLDYKIASKNALLLTLKSLSIACDFEKLFSFYTIQNLALWEKMEKKEIELAQLRCERFEILIREYGWQNVTSFEIDALYLRFLSSQSDLLSGVESALQELSAHKMGLLTNGIAFVQRQRIKNAGIAGHFAHFTISQECGFSKPDRRIFDLAVKESGVAVNRILFIGDSVSSDMAGANMAGIDFCWVNSEDVSEKDEYHFKFRVGSVQELPAILNAPRLVQADSSTDAKFTKILRSHPKLCI